MSERAGVRARFVDADAAAALVRDGATMAVSGSGGGIVEPDAILAAIERRFLATGHPRDLTLVHALGIGDGSGSGVGRLAHEGLLRRVIGGHWAWSAELQRMAREEIIEAYTLPAGVIMTLYREIGAGRPGVFTHIGLGTFADPRHGGGKCNARTTEDLVESLVIDGRPWLRYKPFPVDVAVLRGSKADPSGNLSLQHEAADIDAPAVALAGRNSGGIVLAQVKERQATGILPARLARIPGVLVDRVVVDPDQRQTRISDYDPALSGEIAADGAPIELEMPEGLRRLIAARALRELRPGQSVNFGYGIPGGIPGLLAASGRLDDIWSSVEQGIHNGRMLDGYMFGAARFPESIVSSLDQFDFYSGGGIDIAFLGMGELDGAGNVNVSMLGPSVIGPGGFVDITQGARHVVFCGTFEAKGLSAAVAGDRLEIGAPGEVGKLVAAARHITFSGDRAREQGQRVTYITERAVFELRPDGIELTELAPGVDLERDVLARMGFRPIVGAPRPMPLQ